MSSSTKLLKEYISGIVQEQLRPARRLRIFDFDDTLVRTDARVHVVSEAGERFDLTPGEFAVYDKRRGDRFDYTDFQKLINPRDIKWMNRILHAVHETHGPTGIVVLSARSSHYPIEEFLARRGLHNIEVVALDDASPLTKAAWIDRRIRRDRLQMLEFFDDSHKNVAAIRSLQEHHPGVRIIARHIDHARIASLNS